MVLSRCKLWKKHYFLLIVLLGFFTNSVSYNNWETDSANTSELKLIHRLPQTIVPIYYDLKLIPFLVPDNFTFRGEVRIKLMVLNDTSKITVHSNELKFLDSDITIYKLKEGAEDKEIIKRGYHVENETQFLIIDLKEKLKAGKEYLLKVKYQGDLNEETIGFYRSSYKMDNKTR
jgi:aminopeptidase N